VNQKRTPELDGSGIGRSPHAPTAAPAPARGPESYESGRKDTVICYPNEVTRVIATFDRAGHYVWHCHLDRTGAAHR
jgi:FtsP/CotA-like multicopper oxidase with cupredoxin domain